MIMKLMYGKRNHPAVLRFSEGKHLTSLVYEAEFVFQLVGNTTA
jgi:hypothetical protein